MKGEKKLNMLGWAIKLVIAIPALLLSFIVMSSGISGESDITAQQTLMESGSFNAVTMICIVAVLIAAALIILFFLRFLISRPAEGIKSILGIIVSAIVFFIFYSIGASDTVESLNINTDLIITQGGIDFTHAGIYTTIIGIAVCAILAVFMGFIMKFVKNSKR